MQTYKITNKTKKYSEDFKLIINIFLFLFFTFKIKQKDLELQSQYLICESIQKENSDL